MRASLRILAFACVSGGAAIGAVSIQSPTAPSHASDHATKEAALEIKTVSVLADDTPAAFSTESAQTLKTVQAAALALAERQFEAGEYDAASAILVRLKTQNDPSIDQTQVSFLLGMIAFKKENFTRAEDIFRDILNDRPDLVRVRLELARTLFFMERDQAAAYHFRLALADGLPPEAEANIRRFLNAIQQRKTWSVQANFSLAPDTNVSAGPKDRTVELFGLPFELDDDAAEQSGIGFSSSLSAAYFPKLIGDLRLELRGGGSITDYENNTFDDVFLFAEAGPRFQKRGFSASILSTFSRRFFGGDGFSTSFGGKLSINKGLTSRTRMNIRFAGAHQEYDTVEARNGPVYSAGVTVAHALDTRSTVRAGATVTREQTRSPTLQNTQYGLTAAYQREMPWGITAEAGPQVYYRSFDEFDDINQTVRSDWTFGGSIFITKRDWRLYGFAPVFSYQFLRNESNTDRFDYTRHRFNVGLTRTF